MNNKPPLIFIHGAWHHAKCWAPVIAAFDPTWHVQALNMPGRVFEKTRQYQKITLHDYVDVVQRCLLSLPCPAILIGHSMGGLVISQVAEKYPNRLHSLIYISAFIPHSGESMFDIMNNDIAKHSSTIPLELETDPASNKIALKFSEKNRDLLYHRCDSQRAANALSACIPEPLRAFRTPVFLTDCNFGSVQKHYIHCTDDRILPFSQQKKMIAKTNISSTDILDCDHSPFYSAPNALANLLSVR